jgi:hypothetical protein
MASKPNRSAMSTCARRAIVVATACGSMAAAAGYVALVRGAISVDLGLGRRTRTLGPLLVDIAAPREVVFGVIAAPYGERSTRAAQQKVRVLERGSDMVLAAHYTPVSGGLTATTVETVRFTRPDRVDFRLVRGPVPYVAEAFELEDTEAGTLLTYTGELGTDLWQIGRRWGDLVARRWEAAVAESLAAMRVEAERRAAAGRSAPPAGH